MYRGAHPFLRMLDIFAPIRVRGSMMRFIGREFSDSSPDNFDSKGCPARIPDRSREVVPLFPTSRMSVGADRPWSPLPCTRIVESFSSMSIPSVRKHRIVARQSAPSKKLCIYVVPLAIDPNITHRCETDLSPGTEIFPFNPVILHNSI